MEPWSVHACGIVNCDRRWDGWRAAGKTGNGAVEGCGVPVLLLMSWSYLHDGLFGVEVWREDLDAPGSREAT